MPYLEKILSHKGYDRCQYHASRLLLKIATVPALIALMKKGKSGFQNDAAKILKEKADPNSIPGLISIIKGEFLRKRKAEAIEILGLIGEKSTIPLLIELLNENDYNQKKAAVYALSRIQDVRAVPALINVLKDRYLRDSTSEALIKIGEPALSYLEEAKKREENSIIKIIDEIIAEIVNRHKQNYSLLMKTKKL